MDGILQCSYTGAGVYVQCEGKSNKNHHAEIIFYAMESFEREITWV